jgi:LacI family repressor for deo operon, udp, cdd, tsx, nupC, and nupG
MREASNVKIEDVANKAGVSVATVSRVMNDFPNVRESTRQRVLETMRELSYSPNVAARNLRKRASNNILVLTPNFTNPFYSHILSGISEYARQIDYSVFIVPYESEKSIDGIMKNLFDSQKADGAILLSFNYDDDWLVDFEKDYFLVQCAEFTKKTSHIPHISIDNYKAMYDMTRHMQTLGHKRIALVVNDNKFISTGLRRKGFIDAIEEAGYNYDYEKYIYLGKDYGFETGIEAARKLLLMDEPPTAILCFSDILALGVINGANELGRKVPEDVSVTGFDDVDYTKMLHPYLTTVKQPCYELGKRSMELLNKYINTKECEHEIYLPYEIKIRESTKKI